MGSTGEVTFLQSNVIQHAPGKGNVLRFASVRRTGQRQLVVAPPQFVEPTRLEKRHHLKWFTTGTPRAHEVPVVRGGNERIVRPNDSGMDAVPRFDIRASGSDDVQLERFHLVGILQR
jgi:hypothetical protein